MAYFNGANNTSFYSTPSASGEFYSYPPPSQMFPTHAEGANSQVYADPTDQWSMVRRSGPIVGSPTSLRATVSYGEYHSNRSIDWCLTQEPPESLAPTTLHTNETDDDSWLSYDWSGNHRHVQSHPSGFLSRHDSFASTAASEASAAVQTPSSGGYSFEELGAHQSQTVPLNYWEINQSGAPTSTSYAVSARARPSIHYPPTPFHRRTQILPTGPGLIQLGQRSCRQCGTNRTRCPVLDRLGTGTLRRDRRPRRLRSFHTSTHQSYDPPEGYPRPRLTPKQPNRLQKKIWHQ